MGNFAENLNLGNRFRPPPCMLIVPGPLQTFFYTVIKKHIALAMQIERS